MSSLSRRRVLLLGCLSPQVILAGCGGGGNASPTGQGVVDPLAATSMAIATSNRRPPPPLPRPPVVVMGSPEAVTFVAGASRSIDLNGTLPANVLRGGTFSVDPSGTSLPAGVSLAINGMLTLASTVPAGVTNGVFFSYTTA